MQLHVMLRIVVVYVIFLLWIMLTLTQLGNNENPIAAFVVADFLVTLAFCSLCFGTVILAAITPSVLGEYAFALDDGILVNFLRYYSS